MLPSLMAPSGFSAERAPPEVLRALITRSGAEIVAADRLQGQPRPLENVREAPSPDYIVRVIDERGQSVPSFQIMIQTAARGSTMWTTGAGGLVTLGGYQSTQYRDQWAIDSLVRADGFAGSIARFAGSDREEFFAGKATITMHHGEQIALHFRLPQGLRLPDDLAPEVYLAGHRDAVRIMWDPENRRAYEGHMPDVNFLNVKRTNGGRLCLPSCP
jgi:hypothetical protein